MPSWLKSATLLSSTFTLAALFSAACDPSYGITSFRCDPSSPNCPTQYNSGTYVCCSDDPASLDFSDVDAVALPSYKGGSGIPLFSGANNNAGTSGYCIDTTQVPLSAGITEPGPGQGCPLPCNPTWAAEDITAVCGGGTFCCPTVELDTSDCAFDPDIGCWRPVTGGDITGLGGLDVSDWRGSAHATHQNPGGGGCKAFIAANTGAWSDAGLSENQALAACYRQLSVADQRGYCQSTQCPQADPTYIDACEQLNLAEGRTEC